MFYSLLDATYLVDTLEPIVKWTTIGVAIAIVLAGVFFFFAKKDAFKSYAKYAGIFAVCYALFIGILMLVLEIVKHYSGSYADDNWLNHELIVTNLLLPMLIVMVIILVSLAAMFITNKMNTEKFVLVRNVGGVAILCALVAALICMSVYFTKAIQDGGYYDGGYGEVNQIVLYASAAALVVVAIGVAFFFDKSTTKLDSHCIALAGITVALSFALSYIKLFEMPQGGSVTFLSLLPVILFSYLYGMKKGLLVGFIYGLLQAIQDPWIIHPAQFLLDYPIAFAMVGFAGAFANIKALDKLPQVKFALGIILVSALRFIAHVLSGVFAFNAYALDAGMDVWAYSLGYNSFVFVDIAFVLVGGIILFSVASARKEFERYVQR